MRVISTVTLLMFLCPAFLHARLQDCSTVFLEAQIRALTELSLDRPVYVEDGAADGTLADFRDDVPGPVRNLTDCPNQAGPLLIDHLDDFRQTLIQSETRKNSGAPAVVPLGYLCLDLLLALTADMESVWIQDCADDGFGACIKEGLYFRPDDYTVVGQMLIPTDRVTEAKRRWTALLAAGLLRFTNPSR
jgi:hypothetical protein